MRPLTILIKPASSLCNMRCAYCFYHSVSNSRERASYGIMTNDVMTRLIRRALDESDYITFAFQGGEPTLAGLEFFRDFISETRRRNIRQVPVRYTIQTNGLAISLAFAEFIRDNDFLVGLSLDGPKDINDRMRVDTSGKSTFQKTMNTSGIFNKLNVQYNILCVVNAHVARNIERVYRFFRKQGFEYLQFIPCLDPLDDPPFAAKHSLTPELYSRFMIRLFELWADDVMTGRGVSIRYFDNLLQTAAGYPSEMCGMQGRCPGQFVIESDGSIYPCDFYCVDNWRVGNIADMMFSEAFASPVMQKFIATSIYNDEACRKCCYFPLCRGGCRRDRDARSNGEAQGNLYCDALKNFFAVATPRLPALLRQLGLPHNNRNCY